MEDLEIPELDRIGLDRNTLKGQVAVVTGAGRGIGREIALVFSYLGACVAIAELSGEGLETEREAKASGGQAIFVRTDVSSETDVSALAQAVHQAFGQVNILINNAILCPVARLQDMDVATWDRVIAVNLRGTFLTSKTFLPDMLANKRGAIVNMISTDAMPGLSAYIASKKGIAGFSQSLAAEVGQEGIQVIAFAPGLVDTPAIRSVAADLAPQIGVSAEQFLNISLHPAYEGLMPARHAGIATAYLVARLAPEYHGEIVTGYEVLERSGLIAKPEISASITKPGGNGSSEHLDTEIAPASMTQSDQAREEAAHLNDKALEEAVHLSGQLQEIIHYTEVEFNHLPVFFRPMARGGFKGKAGQSLQDWKRTADRLSQQIKETQAGSDRARQAIQANLKDLKASLEKLIVYYDGVPEEAARFIREPDHLRELRRLSNDRIAVIRSLSEALSTIAAGELS